MQVRKFYVINYNKSEKYFMIFQQLLNYDSKFDVANNRLPRFTSL